MSACIQCKKELAFNEIGANKKFINRGIAVFLCKECLAKKLDITPALIDHKIEEFKKQGCTLFV
jgi:uncharacterized protein YlaI